MNFKKILLAASIGTTTFSAANLYAVNITPNTAKFSSAEIHQYESLLVANLDSLFPYQVKVAVGSIEKASDGKIVAENVFLVSNNKMNPNIYINKIELDGIDVAKNVTKDFTIKVEGLRVSNLATALASTNVVSGRVDTKSLVKKESLYTVLMDNLGKSVVDLTIDYSSYNKSLVINFDSTYANQKLAQSRIELSSVDLSDTIVDRDFLASLQDRVADGMLKNAKFDTDFTQLLKDVTTDYLGKNFKKTPVFKINGSMGEVTGELKLSMVGELGSENHFDYSLVVDGINYADTKLKDLLVNDHKILDNAYVTSDKGSLKSNFNFKKRHFSSSPIIQQFFTFLGRDEISLAIDSNRNFDGSKYNSNMQVSAKDLASFDASTSGVVDGKLKVLPYLTVKPTATMTDLYDCKDQLCMTQMNASFVNDGLLEKLARLTNKDPNTTPQQILGSYGALLQLFAVQQKDKFLRDTLSSLAMFLQNPKNIGVSIKPNKPMNENALATILIQDAQSMQKDNPMKGSKVDLKSNKNLELLNDIEKYFKVDYTVNQ